MEIKELTTKSHETARKMLPASCFFVFVRGSSLKNVEIRLLDRIFAPNIFRSILLAAILMGFLSTALRAQPPNAYLIKHAAADDTLREGSVLLAQETLEANRRAYDLCLKARAIYKEIGDRDGEGRALFAASQAAQALGDRMSAFRLANEALPFFKNHRHKWWQARFYNHIGLLGTSVGEREYSIKFYWLSLNIWKQLDDFDEAIPVINNIGRHFEEGGEYEKALEMFNLTLKYIDSGALDVRMSEAANRGLVLNNIAGVYLKQGKTTESLETYERALALHRAENLPRAEMTTINNIGTVHYKTGDYEKARERFNQALLLNRLVGDKPLEASTLMNLMSVLHKTGNSREAVFFGKQAINLYQWMRSNIRGFGDKYTEKTYLRTIENDYRALADILIEAGLFSQAEQVLRMLKEEEFFEFVGRDESEIASLGQRVALTPKEQELIVRYTALSGRITAIGARFLTLDARKRLLEKKRETLTSAEQTEYDLLSAQLADANAAFRLFLNKELSRELGAENKQTVEYDRGLQANIGLWEKGTVVLHTVVVQNRYRVVLTTPAVQVDGKTDIDISVLNKKIFAFRAALHDRSVDPRPLGKELYDILVLPVEKDLQAAGARTLVWSLDGPLRYIPFAALSPDGKTYLVEKYQNTVLTPRTRDGISEANSNWSVLGVGVSNASTVPDPSDANQMIQFKALPGARTELMKIVRDGNKPGETGIFSGRRLMNKDFTAAAFANSLAGASGRKFNAVHMASHFRLGDDRSSSFLLLGDGTTLSLEAISRSPGISFGGVELVTLSACNTAFGTNSTGREIDSLADIIQAKSGKAVLATLWSVSDESTSMLMSEFYRIRKDLPLTGKAGAIQSVQKQFIEGRLKVNLTRAEIFRPKPDTAVSSSGQPKFVFDPAKPFAHPYYWSPFVLIGNWR